MITEHTAAVAECRASLRAFSNWDRHEQVRIATLRYLNGGVDAPKGWTKPGHPLFEALGEWWRDERKRLLSILG